MKRIISLLLCFALLFSSSILVFAEDAPQADKPTVRITAKTAQTVDSTGSSSDDHRLDYLTVELMNVEDFSRCEVNITINDPPYFYNDYHLFENMDASFDKLANCRTKAEKLQDGSYTLILEPPLKNDFYPYGIFTFLSKDGVPLEFTVNSVKVYSADGECVGDELTVDVLKLNNKETVMKYDMSGDGKVAAEDARLALRFAVGLDTATDDQRYAAGLVGDGEFTSALARDILRAAVGLA